MDSPTPLEGRQATQNSGLTALSPSPLNADFLANEGSLYDLQNIVHGLTPPREVEEERQSLLCRISSKLDALHAYKRQEWTRQRALGDRAEEEAQHALYRIHVNTDEYFDRSLAAWNPVVLICHVLVLIMHLTCKLPRRSAGVLLAGLRSVVATTLTACNGSEVDVQMILQGLPQDPRTVMSAFDIDPRFDSCQFQDTPSDPVCGAKYWTSKG
ncbi:hypothetical protein EYR36_003902 [Pleurotus pulmonarius]|nr:hypothetical protein EYR36_003902 [Pleurotus pulmonarius]